MPKATGRSLSSNYLNRELSWLEFNARVLEEAQDPVNHLLERVKFWCIFSSNLDEYFEVRVAGIKQQIESKVTTRGPDGLSPQETFKVVTKRVRKLVAEQYRYWKDVLQPELAEHRIRFLTPKELNDKDLKWLKNYYLEQVRPILTPLSIDPAHPFPQLLNKSLNLMVQLEIEEKGVKKERLAVVQAPRNLPRLLKLPRTNGWMDYLFLPDLISHYCSDVFPGAKVLRVSRFRLTRNSELYIDEEDSGSLLNSVEKVLRDRRKGNAVRLEVRSDTPMAIREKLLTTLALTEEDLYVVDGPLNPTRLMEVYGDARIPELLDPPMKPKVNAQLKGKADIFAAIRKRDVLLFHPYESFESVIEFLEQAAEDPGVLAIKQTLYRTGGDERFFQALMRAVANGKQVTTVVELKARFDEANNIEWARRLEKVGVHVVYGLVGYKIHCKMCLVVRKDPDGIRRYLHLSSGNYNSFTAKLYTDIGLLTCDPELGEDATNLFNLLTGVCQFPGMSKLLVAPFDLHDRMMALVEREAENAIQGLPARIVLKMNSLVDPAMIDALYNASKAGVQIDLIVRGICCLRPGVKGLSENIEVRSIVGRFLEHSRIFYFENACRPEVFLGSADWMPRNFFRRIEVVFPICDGRLRDQILSEVLPAQLEDNAKSRFLGADGRYRRPEITKSVKRINCQEIEIERRSSKNVKTRREGASLDRRKLEVIEKP